MSAPAEIRLDQNTDGEGSGRGILFFLHDDATRRRPGSTFEFVTHHPGAAADASLFNGAAMRCLKRTENVLRLDVETIHVIEPTVPRLAHDGQTPIKTAGISAAFLDAPIDNRITHDADAVRVRDRNG